MSEQGKGVKRKMETLANGVKAVNGRNLVLSMPSAIAIIVLLVGIVASYFAMYTDLQAAITTNTERIKSQDRYFEKEFEHIRNDLTEIKEILREDKK